MPCFENPLLIGYALSIALCVLSASAAFVQTSPCRGGFKLTRPDSGDFSSSAGNGPKFQPLPALICIGLRLLTSSPCER